MGAVDEDPFHLANASQSYLLLQSAHSHSTRTDIWKLRPLVGPYQPDFFPKMSSLYYISTQVLKYLSITTWATLGSPGVCISSVNSTVLTGAMFL